MIETWIATYALHSTIILGGAWLLIRQTPLRWHAGRDLIWKTALVGGLVTTSLAAWIPGGTFGPIGSHSTSATAAPDSPAGLTPSDGVGSAAGARSGDLGAISTRSAEPADRLEGPASLSDISESSIATPTTGAAHSMTGAAGLSPETGPSQGDPGTTHRSEIPLPLVVARLALLLAGAGLVFGTIRIARSVIRIRTVLGDRRPVEDGPVWTELQRVREQAGVRRRIRLSEAPGAPGPLALGWNEICFPSHALHDLAPGEREAALAHELGHLVRRDPFWFTFAQLLESAFFFLPLHRIARRGIQVEAEYLCDDWAVARTGSRVELARCLAKVAENVHGRALPAPAASMSGPAPLLSRVRRLLEPSEAPMPAGARAALFAGALALLAACALFAPRFAQTGMAAVRGEPHLRVLPDPPAPRPAPRPLAEALQTWPHAIVELQQGKHEGNRLHEILDLEPLHEVLELAPLHDVLDLRGLHRNDRFDVDRLRELQAELQALEDEDLLDIELEDLETAPFEEGSVTFRIDNDQGDVRAHFEDGELVSVERDGREVPSDLWTFEDGLLSVVDPSGEEVFEAEIDLEEMNEVRERLFELQTKELPALEMRLQEVLGEGGELERALRKSSEALERALRNRDLEGDLRSSLSEADAVERMREAEHRLQEALRSEREKEFEIQERLRTFPDRDRGRSREMEIQRLEEQLRLRERALKEQQRELERQRRRLEDLKDGKDSSSTDPDEDWGAVLTTRPGLAPPAPSAPGAPVLVGPPARGDLAVVPDAEPPILLAPDSKAPAILLPRPPGGDGSVPDEPGIFRMPPQAPSGPDAGDLRDPDYRNHW